MTHLCPTKDKGTLREEEEDARTILAPLVDGAPVAWDDGTEDRMWDLCLVGDRGDHAATVEVTRSANQETLEFHIRLERAGEVWEAPGLDPGWTVLLSVSTNPLKVDRNALAEMLADAAADGIEKIVVHGFKLWRDRLEKLGVHAAWQRRGDAGAIFVSRTSDWWTGRGHVAGHVSAEADANATKLQAAPGPRHLFVWIDWSDIPATFDMREAPDGDPLTLPEWVDVAWAACGEWSLDQTILWRGVDGKPWELIRGLD